MGAPFYVPAVFELVDDRDHPTRGDIEGVGESLLGLALVEGNEVEHGEMAGFEAERFEAGGKAAARRVADFGEQKDEARRRPNLTLTGLGGVHLKTLAFCNHLC